MKKKYEDMTVEELQAELKRLKDNLCDTEDLHSFTFIKTSVHIGAEKAQNLQVEYDEECRMYTRKIADVEQLWKQRGAGWG